MLSSGADSGASKVTVWVQLLETVGKEKKVNAAGQKSASIDSRGNFPYLLKYSRVFCWRVRSWIYYLIRNRFYCFHIIRYDELHLKSVFDSHPIGVEEGSWKEGSSSATWTIMTRCLRYNPITALNFQWQLPL